MTLDPRRNAYRADLADAELRGEVEAARFVSGEDGQIIVSAAPLHRLPDESGGIDTQALYGEQLRIFERNGNWAWVQLSDDGYVGYMPLSCVGVRNISASHHVRALRTFIYPEASMKLPTGRYLGMGCRVQVTGQNGDFFEIAGGGFIYTRHLSAQNEAEPDFVAVAERFLETPYLWGGKSSLGIDCSGLVQLSLKMSGLNAPRDTYMQEAEFGQAVEIAPDLSGLQRGDLIFWKGHVAIMLDTTTMIHANGWSMNVLVEPLAVAERRIRETSDSRITSIRRLVR